MGELDIFSSMAFLLYRKIAMESDSADVWIIWRFFRLTIFPRMAPIQAGIDCVKNSNGSRRRLFSGSWPHYGIGLVNELLRR